MWVIQDLYTDEHSIHFLDNDTEFMNEPIIGSWPKNKWPDYQAKKFKTKREADRWARYLNIWQRKERANNWSKYINEGIKKLNFESYEVDD